MFKLVILLIISAMFASFGYLINAKNAKYYLSGYWKLNDEDKEKVDLINFLIFFKRFHLGLGVSLFSVGIIGGLLFNAKVTLIALIAFILLAYFFMVVYSSRYWKGLKQK